MTTLKKDKKDRWYLSGTPNWKHGVPDRKSDFNCADVGCTVEITKKTHDTAPRQRRGVIFYLIKHNAGACASCKKRAAFKRRDEWLSSIQEPERSLLKAILGKEVCWPRYVGEKTEAQLQILFGLQKWGLAEEGEPRLDHLPQAVEAIRIMTRLRELSQTQAHVASEIREEIERRFPLPEPEEIFVPKDTQPGTFRVSLEGLCVLVRHTESVECHGVDSSGNRPVVTSHYDKWEACDETAVPTEFKRDIEMAKEAINKLKKERSRVREQRRLFKEKAEIRLKALVSAEEALVLQAKAL